jgi:hypothetical protein
VHIVVYKQNIGKILYLNLLANVVLCRFIVICQPYSPCGSVNDICLSIDEMSRICLWKTIQWARYRTRFHQKNRFILHAFSIDPGEVAICFGDDGTWCPLYQHDNDGKFYQEYSDGEETVSSLSSDDDLLHSKQNHQTFDINDTTCIQTVPITADTNNSRSSSSLASMNSRASSPYINSMINRDYSGEWFSLISTFNSECSDWSWSRD